MPKIVIVYIYALGGESGYRDKALGFVDSYLKHAPGIAHETLIVCNGVPANEDTRSIFSPLPDVFYFDRDDSGWDIGGFQDAADTVSADMMVFFGGHTYFRKSGWLARMWSVYQEHGNTLYGCTGSQGSLQFIVYPHVRTTAFWCHPSLMSEYPYRISQKGSGGQRYEAEHGPTCITNWVRSKGMQPWIVGWHSVTPVQQCDSVPNGFQKGNQSDVLVGDRLTAPPYFAIP